MTEIRADTLRYPVIFFWDDPAIGQDFEIWRETTSLGSRGKGVLVDRDGVCFRVIRAEVVGLHLPRAERLLLTDRGETLFCDGEPFLTSVDKVREKIVWLVSARGDFERPQGLPCAVDFATGVWELLEAMRGFDRFHLGFF